MADKTIGDLAAVQEAAIGSLPGIQALYDDTLIPVEQQGEAMHMSGKQFRQFGEKTAEIYVQAAARDAEDARKSKEAAAESAERAEQYSGKPPIIQSRTWWTWDAKRQEYVDTGEIAIGNVMYAVFFMDPGTGELYMVYDREYTGPEFRLINGADLEVLLEIE